MTYVVNQGSSIEIAPYRAIADNPQLVDDVESILFETAGQRIFSDEIARAAFRHLWLGLYLDDSPDLAFVAVEQLADRVPRVVGYVVGWPESAHGDARFAGLDYFACVADLLREAPAHLHVNLTSSARGKGVGRRLIVRLVDRLRERRVPALHVFTGAYADNVGFYVRCGFEPRACVLWQGRRLLCLTRSVARDEAS